MFVRKILIGCGFAAALAMLGCEVEMSETQDDQTEDERAPLGKQDEAGSCRGSRGDYCGGKSDGACWCDDLCDGYGDCCADRSAVCDCAPATCERDECGDVDDGCGGTLACGECPGRDPFDFDASRRSISLLELVEYFPPGTTRVSGGQFTLVGRTRAQCTELTGCSAWNQPAQVSLAQLGDGGGHQSGHAHAVPSSGDVSLKIVNDESVRIRFSSPEPGVPGNVIRMYCGNVRASGDNVLDCTSRVDFPSGSPIVLRFRDFYVGRPLFDNTTAMEWQGRIFEDGSYQFVTKLGSDMGTMISGANNRNQLSISGQLVH